MRVVYVNPVGLLGGAELSLLDLMAAVGEARPDLQRHLIVGTEGPMAERARNFGIEVHALPMPQRIAGLGDSALGGGPALLSLLSFAARSAPEAGAAYLYARRLRALLNKLSPHIIHSNGIKTHCLLSVMKPQKAPVVWHVRDFLGSRALMSKVLRWASSGAAAAIAISEAVRQDTVRVMRSVPVAKMYDAIDIAAFSPGEADGASLDREAGLPCSRQGTIRIGLVATYARWKGQVLFLEAAALLARRCPELPLRFFIIGGPIYHTAGSQFSSAELNARISSLGLSECAGLVPFQSDPAHVYRKLDVVVHASTKPEPFGRTIAEAMSCERPVIISRAGGAIELVRDGEDALSFIPNDAESLAGAMEALAVDPALRLRIARAARGAAIERFSRPRLGREVLAFYDEVHASARVP